MSRTLKAAVACTCIALLAGCSVYSSKTKVDDKKTRKEIEVLGITIWKTEKPLRNTGR